MRAATVPWCDECERFLTPTSLDGAGRCPTCGRAVQAEEAVAEAVDEAPVKVPWHFKLLVLATVVYLGWRAVQGLSWLAHHL